MSASAAVMMSRDSLPLQVSRALDAAGIRWCLLRERRAHAGNEPRDDVDLLIDETNLPALCSTLAPLGFARIPAWGRGDHQFWVAYQPDRDSWIKLDVLPRLTFGVHQAFSTTVAPSLLDRRTRAGEVWQLHADDAFWALLLHCLLDRGDIPEKYHALLVSLAIAATDDSPLALLATSRAPHGWNAARCRSEAANSNWETLAAAAAPTRRAWMQSAGCRGRAVAATNAALQRMTKPLNLLRRRGLSVALLGPDGAGKSTLAEGIEQSFYFPVRQVYMGLYQGQGPRGSGAPGLGLAVRVIRQWRRYMTSASHRARGRLVIFDRYSYDALLGPGDPDTFKRRVRRWVLARSCPPPDLALVLNAPGEVLFARKHEHSPELLEAQRQQYLSLSHAMPGIEVVDATAPPDTLRRDIVARIWRSYAARWN